MIDMDFSIEPWIGLGGFELYTHISQLVDVLVDEKSKPQLLGRFLLRYEIEVKVN